MICNKCEVEHEDWRSDWDSLMGCMKWSCENCGAEKRNFRRVWLSEK